MSSIKWRKSSFSGADNECVELSVGQRSTGVRDSKAPNTGSLVFGAVQFHGFLAAVKVEQL